MGLALQDSFGPIGEDGADIVAVRPAPDENVWLFGLVVVREQRLLARGAGETGRGERDSPTTSDLPITLRLAEPPTPHQLFWSA